jgi:hypothetical protein
MDIYKTTVSDLLWEILLKLMALEALKFSIGRRHIIKLIDRT